MQAASAAAPAAALADTQHCKLVEESGLSLTHAAFAEWRLVKAIGHGAFSKVRKNRKRSQLPSTPPSAPWPVPRARAMRARTEILRAAAQVFLATRWGAAAGGDGEGACVLKVVNLGSECTIREDYKPILRSEGQFLQHFEQPGFVKCHQAWGGVMEPGCAPATCNNTKRPNQTRRAAPFAGGTVVCVRRVRCRRRAKASWCRAGHCRSARSIALPGTPCTTACPLRCRADAEPDNLVLALEHLTGGMLLDRLKQGPMSEAHAAAAFYQILTCILFMHHDGYLHRDLKPDNVMLARRWCPEANADEPPPVRLIDLGMVLHFTRQPNETGLMGSPGYMSPEAIRCAPLPRSVQGWLLPLRRCNPGSGG